mmetsp:Transcript_29068/g.48873  ORF Transcript_29068/g.48873 Transcript_29068/m.48873 type:complete len:313 (-) Transcript_29068:9-947(-)
MMDAVAADVPGATTASASVTDSLDHGLDDSRVMAHGEIVVAAPNGCGNGLFHFLRVFHSVCVWLFYEIGLAVRALFLEACRRRCGLGVMAAGDRKGPDLSLNVSKVPVPSFLADVLDDLLEAFFVVHTCLGSLCGAQGLKRKAERGDGRGGVLFCGKRNRRGRSRRSFFCGKGRRRRRLWALGLKNDLGEGTLVHKVLEGLVVHFLMSFWALGLSGLFLDERSHLPEDRALSCHHRGHQNRPDPVRGQSLLNDPVCDGCRPRAHPVHQVHHHLLLSTFFFFFSTSFSFLFGSLRAFLRAGGLSCGLCLSGVL